MLFVVKPPLRLAFLFVGYNYCHKIVIQVLNTPCAFFLGLLFNKVRGSRYGRGGRGIKPSVADAEQILGSYPGLVLDRARFLVGEIALVCCKATAIEAVLYTALGNAVVKDRDDHRQHLGGVGEGGGVRNGTGDVGYAVVYYAVNDVTGVIVVGFVARLDCTGVIV